jgi:hypothetical protein
MDINLKLSNNEYKDLIAYCNLNDLLISSVVKDSFTTGFNIERYGLLNSGVGQEKQVEREVIVEKRVEIPIEVIKEVVKIEYVEVEKPVEKIVEITKEVPVERVVEKVVEITKEVPVDKVVIQEIIKEVPVEKIVYVTDQEEMKTKIFEKEQEFEEQRRLFSTKSADLEKSFQESLAQKDKELYELRRTLDEISNKPAVEKIVEVIKEVPIEVVKEIVIEKEGDSNIDKIEALQKTIYKLRQENVDKEKVINELSKTINNIQNHQEQTKALFLDGSNLDKKLLK